MAQRVLIVSMLAAALGFMCGCGLTAQHAGQPALKETFTYKRIDGTALEADVYRLPGGDDRPAILWLHGGALIFGNRGSVVDHQLERYIRAGYVVASIDYRLAPETKLPAIVGDVQDAYRWLREEGPGRFQVDPDRIAVIGNSAGGYLALWAASAAVPRPRAVVSFYGYGDISREWTTRPSPYYLSQDRVAKDDAYQVVGQGVLAESPIFPRVLFYTYCRQNGLWPREVVGVDPATEQSELERFSPTLHVTADSSPTMLLHGSKDTDVPFDESERMAVALEKHRVPHRFVRLDDYDHLFDVFPEGWQTDEPPSELKDPTVLAAFDAVLQFLDEHLAKRP